MKLFLIGLVASTVLLLPAHAHDVCDYNGQEWQGSWDDHQAYLESCRDADIRFPIRAGTGGPEVLGVLDVSDVELVVYLAQQAGTSVIITEWRAMVFHPASGESLGDYPFMYYGSQRKYTPSQPIWIIHGDSIEITDENENLDVTVPINPADAHTRGR